MTSGPSLSLLEPAPAPRLLPPPARLAAINWQRWLSLIEVAVAGMTFAVAGCLHWQQKSAAGGLWRDEVTSIDVATMPTLAGTWRYLEFDSYPILYHLVLRAWCAGFGAGDASLRTLGFLVGLGLLGTCWVVVRTMGVRLPLLAWALFGLNPLVVRFVDSNRAYGLGCALALLAFAAWWRAAQTDRVDWRRMAWAALAGVLSVQCLYHNAALLFASALGAALFAGLQRRPRVALALLACGLPAGLSLLPYLPTIHRTGLWSILFHYPVTLGWLWSRLAETVNGAYPYGIWWWTALVCLAVAVAVARLWLTFGKHAANTAGERVRQSASQLGAVTTMIAALAGYAAFLYILGYITQPWYYLPLCALVVGCLDGVLGQPRETLGRAVRLAVAVGWMGLTLGSTEANLTRRSTNLDLVARHLNARTGTDDLIVVLQWEQAITLSRYYHGSAPLVTVPPLADHSVHRYDLILEAMQQADPLQPVEARVEQVLRAGGRVWIVGDLVLPPAGQKMPTLAPDHMDPNGHWHFGRYYHGWPLHVAQFVTDHCVQGSQITTIPEDRVSGYEWGQLLEVSGWQPHGS